MPFTYALDSPEAQKERISYQILFSSLNVEHWMWTGKDTFDHGVDYGFEYIEDGMYKGYRIISQVKSSTKLEVKDGLIPFDFPVNTAAAAINSAQPFVFFLVDLNTKVTYYLALQDYFIANKEKIDSVRDNKSTVRLFIPVNNVVCEEDAELREIAKSQYSFNENLVKTR